MKITIDLDDCFFEEKDTFYFYLWSVKEAVSVDKNVVFNGKIMALKSGQLVSSLNSMHNGTGLSKWKIRHILKKLKKAKKISTQATRSQHTITILDYDKFQYVKQKNSKPGTRKKHASHTQENHSFIYNKKEKEKEYLEKEKEKVFLTPMEREIQEYVKSFMDHIYSQNPKLAPKGESVFDNSCVVIRRLIDIDGFTMAYISEVLEWALNDAFWSSNVRSLAVLRNKRSGMTKFQTIAIKYEASKKKGNVSNSSNNISNLTVLRSIIEEG